MRRRYPRPAWPNAKRPRRKAQRSNIQTRIRHFIFTVLCAVTIAPAHALTNQLKNNPSPYLAAHGDDPVAWQQWNAATIARARREGKLLFVSVGYFSCHWCHVMQRESYRNRAIAARLNRDFIPVKVDRELEPALDARLIDFAQNTRGSAGWPLNVFVTPAGAPLYASLYLPPDEFTALLQKVQSLWLKDRAHLDRLAQEGVVKAQGPGSPQIARKDTEVFYREFIAAAMAQADVVQGGFGSASKFPSAPQLGVLLEAARAPDAQELRAFVLLTFEQMAQQGLQDHLGGGFFRYCVDPGWKTPHFEKMLYDNAQLAVLYLRAAEIFARPDFRAVAARTLDFMLQDMASDAGDFIGALSAVDANNVEGGYYLWSADNLARVLTPAETHAFRAAYSMTDAPPFDAGYLPIPANADVDAPLVKRAAQKLRAARARRTLPRDTKRLAAWNGLALSAFAAAAAQTNDARYRTAAQNIRNQLAQRFWDGKNLRRAIARDTAVGAVSLEDYAYVARGLLTLYRVDRQADDLKLATAIARAGWQRFYRRGWRTSPDGLLLQPPQDLIEDGALPSAAAVMIDATLEIADLTHDPALSAQARAALNTGQAQLHAEPFWYGSYIAAMRRYAN